jgi:hypothetical protein
MDNIRNILRWKCKFDEDGKLIQLPQISGGWDFGRTLDVVCQEGRFYVVRRKGHTAWSGVGMRSYYSTEYLLLEVDISEDEVEFKILKEEQTEDRPWREIRRDMFAEAKELHEADTYCSCEMPRITYKAVPPMCLFCGRLEK